MRYSKKEAKEYAKHKMFGLWGAIPYPFKKNLDLDEEGLVTDLSHYINVLQADGIYMGGIINEFWSLTTEERKKAQEIIIRENAGNINTISMTGHHSIKTSIELTKHAESIGTDFVAIMNPYYAAGTKELIFNYFKEIANSVEIGILILNSPTAGYLLSPEDIESLSEIDNICAIKNDGGLEHTNAVRKLIGDKIVISDPREDNLLVNTIFYKQQVFLAGPSLHLYQWKDHFPIKSYVSLAQQGKISEAKEISATLDPLRNVAKKWIWDPWAKGNLPIARLKFWQSIMGLAGGNVRPPQSEMTETEKEEFRNELEETGLKTE